MVHTINTMISCWEQSAWPGITLYVLIWSTWEHLSLLAEVRQRYWCTLQHCNFAARNTGLISSRFWWLAAFWKRFPHTSLSLIVLIGPELRVTSGDLKKRQGRDEEKKRKMQWYWLFLTILWVFLNQLSITLPSWLINNTLTENAQTKLMEKGITLRNGLTHSTQGLQTHRPTVYKKVLIFKMGGYSRSGH